ncbi:MAG: hypothetical protein J6L88_08925 [Clostridia bacterium]|nr:hypothetical protein [Clostridia bacterium]
MKKQQKNIYACISFLLVAVLWVSLMMFAWLKPADAFSDTERRVLAQMPENWKLSDENFSSNFEAYSVDQFPLRDTFRRIKTYAALYVFGQRDVNGLYYADGHVAKIAYPLDEASVLRATGKFQNLYDMYLGDAANIYVAVVPDKGYYLAEQNGYPALDYDRMATLVQENMPYATWIDVADRLNVTCYYRTDPHWDQRYILDCAKHIALAMDAVPITDTPWEQTMLSDEFLGVYAGQLPLSYEQEEIWVIENETIRNAAVTTIEGGQVASGIYNMDKLHSRDPYETYLSGASALITIENPLAEGDRHLVIFRDSFAGPLAPLLMESYSRITLVDTRYISPGMVGDYVDFEDADVLFIYSTLILNESATLR